MKFFRTIHLHMCVYANESHMHRKLCRMRNKLEDKICNMRHNILSKAEEVAGLMMLRRKEAHILFPEWVFKDYIRWHKWHSDLWYAGVKTSF